jgi:hypothetical protein
MSNTDVYHSLFDIEHSVFDINRSQPLNQMAF